MKTLLLLSVAALHAQPIATVTKLSSGNALCSGDVTPGFESWNEGSGHFATDIGKPVFIMRRCVGPTQSIYANSIWGLNSTTGAWSHIADMNLGGVGAECPGTVTGISSRHSYAGSASALGLYWFGGGSCGGSGFFDLRALNTSTGVIAGKTPNSLVPNQEHAYASDGSKIFTFGGMLAGSPKNGSYLYDPANDAASFVAQHPTTCTDPIGTSCVAGGTNFCSASDTSCPTITRSHTMDYDPINGVYVWYGGTQGSTGSKQTWAYNPTTKAHTRKADGPATQYRPLWAYNSDLRQFVFYAGTAVGSAGTFYTYDFVANAWTTWATNIPGPKLYNSITESTFLSMAYDPVAKKIVIINEPGAGKGNGTVSPEVWTVSFPTSPAGCSSCVSADSIVVKERE